MIAKVSSFFALRLAFFGFKQYNGFLKERKCNMKTRSSKYLYISVLSLIAFAVWTVVVSQIDKQAIGPNGSVVGLATLNGAFHNFTGVHLSLYDLTDLLSIIPFIFIGGFALLALVQWIQRKSVFKIDHSLFALGGFYVVVMAVFLMFENVIINYRPILIEGVLEASYPSSTTMLVMCVFPTAIMQLWGRIKNKPAKIMVSLVLAAFTAFMVICRIISGVHWITDIVGGALLSIGLVTMYAFAVKLKK